MPVANNLVKSLFHMALNKIHSGYVRLPLNTNPACLILNYQNLCQAKPKEQQVDVSPSKNQALCAS